jgi:hypothetical protein
MTQELLRFGLFGIFKGKSNEHKPVELDNSTGIYNDFIDSIKWITDYGVIEFNDNKIYNDEEIFILFKRKIYDLISGKKKLTIIRQHNDILPLFMRSQDPRPTTGPLYDKYKNILHANVLSIKINNISTNNNVKIHNDVAFISGALLFINTGNEFIIEAIDINIKYEYDMKKQPIKSNIILSIYYSGNKDNLMDTIRDFDTDRLFKL